MHARLGKAAEGGICLVGVVQYPRHDDGRCAVFQEVDLSSQPGISVSDALQEIGDGPGDAVALGLPGDDYSVELQELLDEVD